MRIFIGILIILVLIAFYLISTKLNKHEKLPKDFKKNPNVCESCGHAGGCGINTETGGIENE